MIEDFLTNFIFKKKGERGKEKGLGNNGGKRKLKICN